MGYREDLIQRLKNNGHWDQLTGEQQGEYESLSNEQARQLMVKIDQWDMGDEKTVQDLSFFSLARMVASFKGALFELGGPNKAELSQAGRLLAQFFLELREHGLSADEVDEGLRELSPLMISALITVYKGPSSES